MFIDELESIFSLDDAGFVAFNIRFLHIVGNDVAVVALRQVLECGSPAVFLIESSGLGYCIASRQCYRYGCGTNTILIFVVFPSLSDSLGNRFGNMRVVYLEDIIAETLYLRGIAVNRNRFYGIINKLTVLPILHKVIAGIMPVAGRVQRHFMAVSVGADDDSGYFLRTNTVLVILVMPDLSNLNDCMVGRMRIRDSKELTIFRYCYRVYIRGDIVLAQRVSDILTVIEHRDTLECHIAPIRSGSHLFCVLRTIRTIKGQGNRVRTNTITVIVIKPYLCSAVSHGLRLVSIRKIKASSGSYGFLRVTFNRFFFGGIEDNRSFVLILWQVLEAVAPIVVLGQILRAERAICTVQLNLYIRRTDTVLVIVIIPCLCNCLADGFWCMRVGDAQNISGIICCSFANVSCDDIFCYRISDFRAVVEEHGKILECFRESAILGERCFIGLAVRAGKCNRYRVRAHAVLVGSIFPILVDYNIRNRRNMFVGHGESSICITLDFVGVTIDCFLTQSVVNRNTFHPVARQVFEFVLPLSCCCQVCFVNISVRTHQDNMDSRRTNAVLVSVVFPSLRDWDAECFLHMAVRDCERATFVRDGVGVPCYRIFCDCISDFVTVRIKQRYMLEGVLPILCIAQCCFRRRTIRAIHVNCNTVRTYAINIIAIIPDFDNRKVVKLRNMLVRHSDSIAVVNGACGVAYNGGVSIHRIFNDRVLNRLSFVVGRNRAECISQVSIRCFKQCSIRFLERNCFCFTIRQCNGAFQRDDGIFTDAILVISIVPLFGDSQICGFTCVLECIQIIGLTNAIYRNVGFPDKVIVLDCCFRHDLDNMSLCIPHIAGQSLCFGQMIGGNILIREGNQSIFVSC